MPRGIPGFDESAAQEQRERNESYLGIPSIVCGVPLRQMTPMDMAVLTYGRNPYIVGSGDVSHPVAAHFIFNLAVEPFDTIDAALKLVADFSVDEIDEQISEYIEVTFRDQNASSDGDADAPIACYADWLVYRMMRTFSWPEEQTLMTPLRRIWPKLRCWQAEQGLVVKNKLSGANTDQFLCEVQRRINEGTLTQADIDKMNQPWLNSRN